MKRYEEYTEEEWSKRYQLTLKRDKEDLTEEEELFLKEFEDAHYIYGEELMNVNRANAKRWNEYFRKNGYNGEFDHLLK